MNKQEYLFEKVSQIFNEMENIKYALKKLSNPTEIISQLDLIKNNIQTLSSNISNNTQNITEINSSIAEINSDIESINQTNSSMQQSITNNTNNIDSINGRLTQAINNISALVQDYSDFSDSLTALNNLFLELNQDILELNDTTTQISSNLTSSVSTLEQSIEDTNNQVTTNQLNIAQLNLSMDEFHQSVENSIDNMNTRIIDVESTRAKTDASNLTSNNVTSWREKLGISESVINFNNIEQMEVVYDINDSTKLKLGELTYKNGIPTQIDICIGVDFSKYKRLRIYYSHNGYQYSIIGEVDLTIPLSTEYPDNNRATFTEMTSTADKNYLFISGIVTYNRFYINSNGYISRSSNAVNNRPTSSNPKYFVYRIEGIY